MTAADPRREFATEVVRRLHDAGYVAYWAGGCVRDFLLQIEPQDYDVATSALPDQVRQLFGHRRTLAVGASFGVIVVRSPRDAWNVEVATFRTEGPYLDGRRPEHVAFSSPEEDALRRDFTINGMFYDPVEQQVLDYVGGQQDLAGRVVRAIGDAGQRIREDKLRMLRAVRIAARFRFTIEEQTAAAIRGLADEILVVSHERIAQELKKMLLHETRRAAMRSALDLRLLPAIFPELKPIWQPVAGRTSADSAATTAPAEAVHPEAAGSDPRWQKTLDMLDLLPAPSFELACAVLLHELTVLPAPGPVVDPAAEKSAAFHAGVQVVHAICRRLRLSNRETEQICWLLAHRYHLHHAPQLPVATFKRLLAHPRVEELVALNRVEMQVAGRSLAAVEFCENYLRNTPPELIDPPYLLTGDDLIRHGLRPGTAFKLLLDRVRDAQLEGTITTREAALQLVDQLRDRSPHAI